MVSLRTQVSLDGEEFSMVLIPLWEQSFAIRFAANDFAEASTIGHLLTVIQRRVQLHDPLAESSLCSRQRIFYRLRRTLMAAGWSRYDITPQLRLAQAMPLSKRQQQWLLLQKHSGLPLPDLTMPAEWFMVVWGLVSAGVWALAPSWAYAVFTGLAATLVVSNYSFARVAFPAATVGKLASEMFFRHYHASTDGRLVWSEVRAIVLTGLADCSTETEDVSSAELSEQTVLLI